MVWNANSGTDQTQVSRLGASNGGSNKRELFLKQFSGEVLTSFEEKNIAMPLHRVRTISKGKSAQFPSIGVIDAAYHTAGQTILGDSVAHSEITVTVEDNLVTAAFDPKIDEAMNHYEVRSTYSKEMGNALANAADKNIFSTILKAATTISGGDQAGYWTHADFTDLNVIDPDAGGSETATAGVIDTQTGKTSSTGQEFVDKVEAEYIESIKKDQEKNIANSISLGVNSFSRFFKKNKPDLLIILGDRYEILSAAISASILKIPIAHLNGGEVTIGAFDDWIRHSVSKMSSLHFVANKKRWKK